MHSCASVSNNQTNPQWPELVSHSSASADQISCPLDVRLARLACRSSHVSTPSERPRSAYVPSEFTSRGPECASQMYEKIRRRKTMISYRQSQIDLGEAKDLYQASFNNSEIPLQGSYVPLPAGLDPLDYVCNLSLRTAQRRRHIVAELIATEQKYLASLTMVEAEIIEPLMGLSTSDEPVLSPAKMSAIFSNIIDILHVSAGLCVILVERQDWHQLLPENRSSTNLSTIGTLFCHFGHYLKMYRIYCRNFQSATLELERELRTNTLLQQFLLERDLKTVQARLPLQSYLLLPVQRVPRYRLLLQELLWCTPSNHKEYASLQQALLLVCDIAQSIDKTIEQHNKWQELLKLQSTIQDMDAPLIEMPNRILIKHGDIIKICRKSHQTRTMYLFNDCLILTKYIGSSDQAHRIFSRRILMQDVEVEIISPKHATGSQTRVFFRISTMQKSFLAYTLAGKESQRWVDAILETKTNHSMAMDSIQPEPVIHSTLNITRSRRPPSTQLLDLTKLSSIFWATAEQDYPILRGRLAPIWQEDSAASDCQICHDQFSLFRGRHHCRICGRLVCAACSGKRFMTSTQSAVLRSCDSCYAETFGASQNQTVCLEKRIAIS